jgi:hypothetical protein
MKRKNSKEKPNRLYNTGKQVAILQMNYGNSFLNEQKSKSVPVPVSTRDAQDTVLPDIRLAGYPANPVRAGYRISGRILGLATIFLVKYQIYKNSFNNYRLLQALT